MMPRRLVHRHLGLALGTIVAVIGFVVLFSQPRVLQGDTTPLGMLDPNLQVTPVLSTGLSQPIGIVFLGSANDFLVLEKASGQVKRVIGGVVQPNPVLDLAVNSNSERGLLSLVLHPNFPATPYVYIRWTQSSTGADSGLVGDVPLLGNRVDRFIWDTATGTLTQDINLLMLRSRQTDNIAVPGHPGTNNGNEQGNHNGGVLKFGPDGKLYLFMGDQGRRGWLQNLPNGPFLSDPFQDDTFGGPMPDNAHFTGVILRLNDDGSTPTDNPFFAAGASIGGEAGANIQRIYSYGHRNGFGMAFDPYSGSLWDTENGDDSYSELNRIVPGMNGGWIQIAGPLSRMSDFKQIETTLFGSALQQVRYPPTRLAYSAALARSRMFMLPGAVYVDPDLSWRFEIGPAGTAFVTGNALGPEYDGTLWIGSARSFQQVGNNGGSLYRLRLTADRQHIDVSADPRLADRVADNVFTPTKFEGTESETLRIGTGFGITPSIEQGPDGNLYVVSLSDNIVYRISRQP
jgi:glucose/arabinose dehydrogenase